MDRLRSPGGCPWDAEQTHESLLPYLIEETYETGRGDRDRRPRRTCARSSATCCCRWSSTPGSPQEHPDDPWSVDDVAAGIVAKLVRRHPHVFADTGRRSRRSTPRSRPTGRRSRPRRRAAPRPWTASRWRCPPWRWRTSCSHRAGARDGRSCRGPRGRRRRSATRLLARGGQARAARPRRRGRAARRLSAATPSRRAPRRP